jgi:hypothetical protein
MWLSTVKIRFCKGNFPFTVMGFVVTATIKIMLRQDTEYITLYAARRRTANEKSGISKGIKYNVQALCHIFMWIYCGALKSVISGLYMHLKCGRFLLLNTS